MVSSTTLTARKASRSAIGGNQTPVPVPMISVSIRLAAANTRSSEALSIWYATNEVRSMRPRVADEVGRLVFFFESVLFDAAAEAERQQDS